MIVIDASALVEVLLQSSSAAEIERRLRRAEGRLAAPHLIDVEITQVLRRLAASGAMTQRRAESALVSLVEFPIERHAHAPLLRRIWAFRGGMTAYDAVYVALAEALDAPLVTRDARLARSSGHRADIELV